MDRKINKILKDLELCNGFFDFIIEPNESKLLVNYIKQLQKENLKLKKIIKEATKFNKELSELYDIGSMERSNADTNLLILSDAEIIIIKQGDMKDVKD